MDDFLREFKKQNTRKKRTDAASNEVLGMADDAKGHQFFGLRVFTSGLGGATYVPLA
jgi:hypothetical protein